MRSEIATAIRMLSPDDVQERISELGALLHACVHAGASINFVLPFGAHEAEAFWREIVVPGVAAGGRIVLVAERDGHIVGSVQLGIDTPPNQPHRAEVNKLMVHPDMRRRGIARSLMAAIEQEARRCGRSLLTLDTRTGDSAEPLYATLGYRTVGVIPGYCRDPFVDRLDSTTIMFKPL
ncbi:GNAT family N-acetyltransferase [Bauldia litoralis]|uniref:Acetyltransferase (GNAT) family protein n=1 Tax=Bauldia litoralis TaxID=665467 RepID=A0A1G6CQK8_9HYPH|nr:GNAT family N-acetyltransferase [Bauldia litoralis]SDB35183.1 Acetyltransferase (GNAT) family protein [Bauldia litoralis]